jgi:cobalamin biosynthesis protein CobD/CbiB
MLGRTYKIVHVKDTTKAVSVTAKDAHLFGSVNVNSTVATVAGKTSVTFAEAKATTGDWLEFHGMRSHFQRENHVHITYIYRVDWK